MDERKFIMGIIREKFEAPAFDLAYLVAIARRTGEYLPNEVGALLFHALARKGEGGLLATFIKYMDFWEKLGGSSLSPESIDLLASLAKNQCPYLDAAAANLQKRLGGGTDGMDADTWADETRVYGRLSFVHSFNPPNMITVNVAPLWGCDPVENFTQIMMDRIRRHVSDFQKDEGRQISVSACILDREGANGFIRFFKAT